MKKQWIPVVASGLLLALLSNAPVGEARVRSGLAPSNVPTTVTCSFSNPSYSGWCRVTQDLQSGARANRFCFQTLSCLNDVQCVRTICNATTIRRGWKLESVKTAPKKGSAGAR